MKREKRRLMSCLRYEKIESVKKTEAVK